MLDRRGAWVMAMALLGLVLVHGARGLETGTVDQLPCLTCGDPGGGPHDNIRHKPVPTEFPLEGPHRVTADIGGLTTSESEAGASVNGKVRIAFKSARYLPSTISYVLAGFRAVADSTAGAFTRESATFRATGGLEFEHEISMSLPGPKYDIVVLQAFGGPPEIFRVVLLHELAKVRKVECELLEPRTEPFISPLVMDGVKLERRKRNELKQGARLEFNDGRKEGGGEADPEFEIRAWFRKPFRFSWESTYILRILPCPRGSRLDDDMIKVEVKQRYQDLEGRPQITGLVTSGNAAFLGNAKYGISLGTLSIEGGTAGFAEDVGNDRFVHPKGGRPLRGVASTYRVHILTKPTLKVSVCVRGRCLEKIDLPLKFLQAVEVREVSGMDLNLVRLSTTRKEVSIDCMFFDWEPVPER